jgi:hypothetical protein
VETPKGDFSIAQSGPILAPLQGALQ